MYAVRAALAWASGNRRYKRVVRNQEGGTGWAMSRKTHPRTTATAYLGNARGRVPRPDGKGGQTKEKIKANVNGETVESCPASCYLRIE